MLKTFIRFLGILLIISGLLPAQSLKIVTINVWSGLDYRGSFKMGEYETDAVREQRYWILVKQLKALDPDVVALNEANKLPRYARRIACDLDYDAVFHVGLGGLRAGPIGLPLNLREGDVILASKDLDLKYEGRRQLSGGYVGRFFTCHFADATQIVAASINIDNQKIYLFNTHWHASPFANRVQLNRMQDDYLSGKISAKVYVKQVRLAVEGDEWRLNEARKTIRFINKLAADAPLILMGDFNDLPHSEPIALLKNEGLIDSYGAIDSLTGFTWDEQLNTNIRRHYAPPPERLRRNRIDYIFFRGSVLQPDTSKVVFTDTDQGLHPSDHFGVCTIFTIKD